MNEKLKWILHEWDCLSLEDAKQKALTDQQLNLQLRTAGVLVCPKDECFHWIPPGGAADVSGKIHQTLEESFEKGKWKNFPEGGCSCTKKCIRLYQSGEDYFELC